MRLPYRVEAASIDEKYREDKSRLKKLYGTDEFRDKAAELLKTYRVDKKALETSWRHKNPNRPRGRKYLTN